MAQFRPNVANTYQCPDAARALNPVEKIDVSFAGVRLIVLSMFSMRPQAL